MTIHDKQLRRCNQRNGQSKDQDLVLSLSHIFLSYLTYYAHVSLSYDFLKLAHNNHRPLFTIISALYTFNFASRHRLLMLMAHFQAWTEEDEVCLVQKRVSAEGICSPQKMDGQLAYFVASESHNSLGRRFLTK